MLRLEHISFSFGQNVVLKDISMVMEPDRVYGVLGKNGSGKTTLFRNVMGWYQPAQGSITLDGKPVEKDRIAFLETDNYFYPYMKGLEYLDLIRPDARKQGLALAGILNVPLEDLVDSYSTGMKKKLAFIGALILDRPLLLLDEPFNGVDLESNEVLKRLIERHRPGRITLLSSHILSTLFDSCDAIFYLRDGVVEVFGKEKFGELEQEIRREIERKMDAYAGQGDT